jgi:hypothetical protein
VAKAQGNEEGKALGNEEGKATRSGSFYVQKEKSSRAFFFNSGL